MLKVDAEQIDRNNLLVLLDQIEALTKLIRATWLSLIAGCAYAWLTLATMTDASVQANDATLELPIIGSDIPPQGFLIFAPSVILLMFIYVQVNLIRLWSFYRRLPSEIDGLHVSDRVSPWIMTFLLGRNTQTPQPFLELARLSAVLLGWVVPPATIAALGGRYITPGPFHLVFHSLLLATSIVVSVRSAHFAFAQGQKHG